MDHHGDIFLADIEKGSIGVVKKAGYQSIVQDSEKLTGNLDLAISSDGYLYISNKRKTKWK
ncbi:hypothetical protein [Bacillus coahuilensis]|uniref:hypothetical protein n=1 Tax=Bacillus coahuilensis TaxID=408580 RepID=UPI0001850DFE|nr:hypothetical protein [Bacillus coahuilensis]